LEKLDKLEDNRRRGENTIAESRCCSDLWCEKTEEKRIGGLFKLVSFNGKLNKELNRKFFQFSESFSSNLGNITL
jgi:hypothetical protein